MKEIKLIIDGKEVKLTEEQLKQLGIELEGKRKNPFERVGSDDKYYYAIVSGDVLRRIDINDRTDRRLYNAANYFNDRGVRRTGRTSSVAVSQTAKVFV